jgi:hypothetical protein
MAQCPGTGVPAVQLPPAHRPPTAPAVAAEHRLFAVSASPLSIFLFLLSFGFAVLALDPDYQLDSDF